MTTVCTDCAMASDGEAVACIHTTTVDRGGSALGRPRPVLCQVCRRMTGDPHHPHNPACTPGKRVHWDCDCDNTTCPACCWDCTRTRATQPDLFDGAA